MTRHGDLSPSLYTGAMQWSLPLYTYKDCDFELPISLDYSYDGFRPGESTGGIGLGWTLNAGGVITREVRGLRDEYFQQDETSRTVYGYYYAWRDSQVFSAERFELLRAHEISYYGDGDGEETFLEALRDDLPNDVLVCRHSTYNACYDTEPDVFRFNFFGHRGEFRFNSTGRIDVFCPDEPDCDFKIAVDTMQGPDCGTFNFKITTADGYVYSFGTEANSWEYSAGFCWSTDDPKGLRRTSGYGSATVTAWKLTSVKTPGGATLSFIYDEEPDVEVSLFDSYTPAIERLDVISDSPETVPSYRDRHVSLCYTRLLTRIDLNSDRIVSFNWTGCTASQNELCAANYDNSGAFLSKLPPQHVNRLLSSIVIRNWSGTVVETVRLAHNVMGTATGPRRLTLSSVSSRAGGQWTFEYKPAPSGTALPVADNTTDVDIYGYWGGNGITDLRGREDFDDGWLKNQGVCENYSFARASTGALVRIGYPTGGSSEIEYENNRVAKVLDRGWSDLPQLMTFDRDVSGVRVKRITDWNAGALAGRTDFTYEDGVLWYYPRLVAQCDYIKSVMDPDSQTGSLVRLSSTFYARTGFGTTGYSHRLGYGKVTQRYPDGSRTEHTFYGWEDYPDYYSTDAITTVVSDTSPLNDTARTRLLNMFLPASQDQSPLRGAPKSVSEYDARSVLRYRREMVYDPAVPAGVIEGANLFTICGSVTKFRTKPLLKESVETADGLSVSTRWSRDGNGRISRVTTTDLQSGYSKSVSYSYCDGLTGSDASVCPGAVRETVTRTRESATAQAVVTDRGRFSYDRSDGSARPSSMTVYRMDSSGVEDFISVTRDSRLRPTRVVLPGGAYIEYTWDASGRNILSRTENGPEGVSTYRWSDMIGLTSVTYPSGLSERYTYDPHNRLSTVRDSDGDLVRHTSGLLSSDLGGKASRIVTRRFLDSAALTCREDTVYYDGLGRESLTVALSKESSYPSVLQPVCYDLMGRADSAAFLPYAVESLEGLALDSLNVYDWRAAQVAWYEQEYGDGDRAFTERTYEPWRQGRILSERKPGSGRLADDRAVRYQYGLNESGDDVLRFSFSQSGLDSASVRCTGLWDEAALAKTERISEENDTTVVFSDALGRMLLSRAVNGRVRHDTYYIRDQRDSLALVIQPEGSSRVQTGMEMPFDGAFVHDWCFGRLHDGSGRLVWSHVPGDGGSRYAYDRRGRLAYCDDAKMRADGKGRYFVYDDYDRLTEEGICTPTVGIDVIRNGLLYGVTLTQMSSSKEPTRKVSYRTASAPAGAIPSDMAFEEVPGVVTASDTCGTRCLGAVSYEQLRELTDAPGGFTRRAYWYDAKGRTVQILEKTSDGWISRYSTGYDFIGNVTVYDERHTDPSGTVRELKTENTYDGRCRLTRSVRTFDGERQTPVEYSYDALGRLRSKAEKNADASVNIRETTARDILGQVTGIETARANGTAIFSEQISYRWDGMISETVINHNPDSSTPPSSVRNVYSYDRLGRLTGNRRYVNGAETQAGTEKDIEYDLNGNVTFLRRNSDGSADDVYYVYQGNTLTEGCLNPQDEFLELWFTSDANGNLTSNPISGSNIAYNYLNLPAVTSGTTYAYLSDGTRLSVTLSDGSKVVGRGSFVYDVTPSGSVSLDSVSIPEGRIYCSGTPDGEPWTCWNLTDHLGNVRSVVLSGSGMPLEISDYLPYGTRMEEYSLYFEDSRRWHYAGKELQEFGQYGSDLIDFGARQYCPHLCRWTTPDPLADKYPSVSPYAYCNSNPVNFVDPDGKAVYYSRKGDFLASDNVDDGIIYLVNDKYLNITDYSAALVRDSFPDGFEEVGGLIIQRRFEEGSNYTVSEFETVGVDPEVTGFILEPGGPDTTTPNMDKRIPEGVYEIDNYHSVKYKDNYIIFNENVPKSRKILYHKGTNGDNTAGCLLPGTTYDNNGNISRSGDKLTELRVFIESKGAKSVRTIIRNK